ncbi:hypothetical protein THAOC_28788 [Thalassiosira oceanica]|uniref:Uncharacterized protein n=1 Tax=Thalassiosira oceanica TaxID=159749 RepID=K0RZA9_THAOC|nr:hypothetical protein THAOC_28788 [Thalassiosira oceanica]|eukprot:EJK51987.1 hypothetical protein THAOC_28788 [Thalassiosira oceanica]
MDALSEQKEWNKLPTRPRPELYQFRGDYVNERNRRGRIGRRDERLQQKRPNTTSKSNKSASLTTRPGVDDNDENQAPNPRKWDSYCAHISCHALAREQEAHKAKNKLKFLTFLKRASSKRQEVASSSGSRKKESGSGQEEADRSQKPKKPPVPRLSKLARSRRTRDKTDMGRAIAGKELTQGSLPPKSMSPYLAFISERPKKDWDNRGRDLSSPRHEDRESVPPGSDVDISISNLSQQDDEESRFRNQVERIVNRAASMVVKEQQQQSLVETDTNTCSVGSSFGGSMALTSGEVETCGDNARGGGGKGSVKPDGIPSIEDELRELEVQVASVCASAVRKNDEEDTSSLLSGSFFDYSTAQSTAFCSSSAGDPFSSYSWMHMNTSSENESSCSFIDTTDTTDGRIAGPHSVPEPVDGPKDVSKGRADLRRADLQGSQVDTAMQPGQDDEDEPLPNRTMNVVPEVCEEDDRCPQPRGISPSDQETEANCPPPRTENDNFGVDSQRLSTANDLLWLWGNS